MNVLKVPKELAERLVRFAVNAEKQRAQIEFSKRVRPLAVYSVAEGVLGLLTLRSASTRKSWLSYTMGIMLLCVCAGHAFLDIRDRKILDLLSEKLS